MISVLFAFHESNNETRLLGWSTQFKSCLFYLILNFIVIYHCYMLVQYVAMQDYQNYLHAPADNPWMIDEYI